MKKVSFLIASILLLSSSLAFSVTNSAEVDSVTLALNRGVLVFDAGDEMYSVVFSSNIPAAGFVRYYFDGAYHTRFAHHDGQVRTTETIHAVRIPRYRLQMGRYTFGVAPIREMSGTTDRIALTPEEEWIFSDNTYNFYGVVCPTNGDNDIVAFAASDWHNNNNWVRALANIAWETEGRPRPDIIFMMGDSFSPSWTSAEMINYIIYSGYLLTRGQIPAVYTRGNHELRGPGANYMSQRFGLRSLFWRTDFNGIAITLFDNGTDWLDANPANGGLIQHYVYRREQLQWLQRIGTPRDRDGNTMYHIALNHMPWLNRRYVSVPAPNTRWCRDLMVYLPITDAPHDPDARIPCPMNAEWVATLYAQNAGLLVSAHTHRHSFGTPGDPVIQNAHATAFATYPFNVIVTGGHTNAVTGRYRAGNLIGNLIMIKDGNLTINAFCHENEWQETHSGRMRR